MKRVDPSVTLLKGNVKFGSYCGKVWYFLKKLNTELPAILLLCTDFPGSSEVKNLPTVQETWVGSLGQEDPLEKKMATHSSILAWKIPWTEEPCGLYSSRGH